MKESKLRVVLKLVFLPILIIGFIILNFWAPIIIIDTKNTSFQPTSNRLQHAGIEKTKETTRDEIKLEGNYAKSISPQTKGIVILLHGIREFKEHFTALSKQLNTEGFNSGEYYA